MVFAVCAQRVSSDIVPDIDGARGGKIASTQLDFGDKKVRNHGRATSRTWVHTARAQLCITASSVPCIRPLIDSIFNRRDNDLVQ